MKVACNFCGRASLNATAQCLKHGAKRRTQSIDRLSAPVIRRLLLSAASVVFVAATGNAAFVSWTLPAGQTGDWSIGSNWSSGTAPGSNDYPYIENGGTATVTLPGAACYELFLGENGPGSLQITSGSLASVQQVVGYSTPGNIVQSGGTNSVSNTLDLGDGSSYGTYALTGSGFVIAQMLVGNIGVGSVTQTGGSVVGGLTLGNDAGSSGTYVLSGGSLNCGLVVGNSGIGSFQQSGGTNTCSSVCLGYSSSGSGTYRLTGGMLQSPSSAYFRAGEYVGYSGNGSFTQSGGTNATDNPLYVGYYDTGAYTLSGGSLYLREMRVGYFATANFTQSGGSATVADLHLGYSGEYGLYALSAGLLSAGSLSVEGGTLTQSGGTVTIAGALAMNELYLLPTKNGTYNLSNGLLSSPSESLSGVFSQTGGLHSAGYVSVGSIGQYYLRGGTLAVSSGLAVQGLLSGTIGSATLVASNSIVDISSGTLASPQSLSVNIGANSLLIVSASFDPYTGFKSFASLGLIHTAGTTLTVPAGEGFSGQGSISDFVNCQGTISSAQGGINLNNGLFISGSGNVDLSGSSLAINGTTSGMSGGVLKSSGLYVGNTKNGTFAQSGGANAVGSLSIGRSGSYKLSGGSLAINVSLLNQGIFDGGGGAGSLYASNAIIDLSQGAVTNAGSMSVNIDANSLLIVPAGFNLGSGFGTLNSQGIDHVAGTVLVVPAGHGFTGQGAINDPVNCQGTILAPTGGSINLVNGLLLSGTGVVSLGSGTLTVNDPISAITGGSLSAATQVIGAQGTGTFSQYGGNSKLTALYVNNGTYNLSGNAQLTASNTYISNGGPGSFNQSGGTNTVSSSLSVGYAGGGTYTISGGLLSAGTVYLGSYLSPGALSQSGTATLTATTILMEGGTYNLTGGGLLSAGSIMVGGDFVQTGGRTAIANITLGSSNGDEMLYGSYNLTGNAQLSATNIYVGSGRITGDFTQSGGTNVVASSLNVGSNYYIGNTLYNTGSSYSLGEGSVLSTKYSYVYGTFLQSGGTHAVANTLTVYGSYDLGDTSLLSAGASDVFGSFTQSGGTHTVATNLNVGGQVAQGSGSGSYSLAGNALLSANNSYLAGAFTQSGGTHAIKNNLYVGYWPSVPNSYYTLSGSALLSASNIYVSDQTNLRGTMTIYGSPLLSAKSVYVGQFGAATVAQSGGTVGIANTLSLGGNYYGANGAYNLSGGLLSAGTLNVSYGSATSFAQSGGTAAIPGALNVYSSAPCSLSGNGQLSAGNMTISGSSTNFTQFGGANTISGPLNISSGTYSIGSGFLSAASVSVGSLYSPATFSQTGGSTSAGLLLIGSSGSYLLSGGTLNVNGGFANQGLLNGAGGPASIVAANSIVDISQGTMQNVGSMSVSIGTNSLVTLPVGFNPYASFHSFTSLGMIHYAGTPIALAAGQGFTGQGSINDLVIGQGTITASPGGGINLNDGLFLAGAGSINMGSGSLTVSDPASGMNGGLLQANNESVQALGSSGTISAAFTQSGGSNEVANSLILVPSLGGSTYNLDGGLLELSQLRSSGASPGLHAAFNFNGGTLRASGSFSTSVPMTLGAAGGNATIDTQGHRVALAGSLSGPGNLIETGGGTLILSGTNNFAGGTTVLSGRMVVTNSEGLLDGSNLIVGKASLFAPIAAANAPPGGSPASPVPEPGTLALVVPVAVGLAASGLRRRRSHAWLCGSNGRSHFGAGSGK